MFSALSRSSFDDSCRISPETWLPLDDLQLIALAYQGHAGYEQARRDTTIPQPVRHRSSSDSRKPRGPPRRLGVRASELVAASDAAGPKRTAAADDKPKPRETQPLWQNAPHARSWTPSTTR